VVAGDSPAAFEFDFAVLAGESPAPTPATGTFTSVPKSIMLRQP
jgi:hypothetical protein